MATNPYLDLLETEEQRVATTDKARAGAVAPDLSSTASPANPYLDHLEDESARQAVGLRAAVRLSAPTSPDAAAAANRLAARAGMPADLVQRNQPEIERRLQVEKVDADTKDSPVLRERFTKTGFAAVAHDDSAPLAQVEKQVASYTFGNALKKGIAGAKLALDFVANELAGAVGADRTETQRILQETAAFYQAQGADPQLQAAGQRAKTAGGGTWYGTLLKLPGEIADEENPFQTVGKFITEQLPASLLGFGIGTAVTAPARAVVVNRVSNALVAQGVSKAVAGAAGSSTAVVLSSLGTNYVEGTSKGLPHDEAASRAWTKTLAEVPANAIAGAALGVRLGHSQLANIGGQAVVQGAGGGIGATMAAHAVGEQADPLEVALEILGEAVSAGPEVAALTFSKVAASKTAARADLAAQAEADAQQLGALVESTEASALKARDPKAFAEFVADTAPAATLTIAPEHLAGVDLSAAPEVAAQVAEAEATGGDVVIAVSDLLAHLPGEQLVPHLRAQPEAMTLAEAQQFDGVAELADELSTAAPVVEGALIQAPELAGMDATAWTEYQATAAEAAQAATHEREARNLTDLKWLEARKDQALREVNRQAVAARETIEAEVVAEVQQQPTYAVQRWLKTGILPDGTATVSAKLSTTALREMYGDGPAAPWRYVATNMLAAEEGMHPDVVAEMFGFVSGDDMVRAVVGAQPEAEVVEGMTDQRLLEQHPDIADTVSRERSAEALIADRARTRFLATEAAALGRAIGNKVLLAKEARAYAGQSISRRKVRDIRPAQFKAAAARAERESALAFAKGDTAMAAKRKQSQVLQASLQDEATELVNEVAQALRSFKKMSKTDAGRDSNLVDAARAILAGYGLAATEKTPADYLEKVKRYDPETAADLAVMMEGLPASVADHRDLTAGDFRAVHDKVQAIWSLARSTRQIEIDGKKVEIQQAADALAAQLAKPSSAKRDTMVVGTNDKLDLRMRLAGVRAALRRVEHWADARDRGDKNGPFRKFVWQPVSEAVTRYRAQRNEYVGRFFKLLKTIEPTLKPGKIAAGELGDGMVFADRSALLHAILHTGNESNKRKLLLGYQWATEREDGSLDTSRWDAFMQRMHAEGRISKRDWDFVQAAWSLLEELKPSAQKAHKGMFGTYFAEITADPVQTPFGEYAGGYVPAVTDQLLVPEGRSQNAMDDMLAGANSPMFPAVARGFTKGRVEDYTKPLALDLRMLPAHIDKVTRFANLGPVLRDTARLVTRNRTFRAAMDAVDPTAIESMLLPWLKRTSAQTLSKAPESQGDRAVSVLANIVRQRTGLLLMSGNVVNTLQQFTGLAVAALRVKPKHLAGGMWQLMRNPLSTGDAINELSPWMLQRSDSSARDVDQAVQQMLTNPGMLKRAEDLGVRYGYVLQQAAQNIIDRTVWMGAYRQAQAAGVDEMQAVRDADSAVRQTQGSFAPEDASKVENAGAFTRLFLMFYSYFNGQANLIATEVQNSQGNAARFAVVYLVGFAVPAFMADVIAKGMRGEIGGDDEDGDELAAKLLESFFLSQARYALGMLPVVGQVGNAAIGQFTPGRFDDRIGASPAYSALEATVRAPVSIYKAATGDGNPKTAVRDGLTAVAVLTGLPTGVLVRPLGHLADDRSEEVTARGLVVGR